jgi:hypothetical protein
MRTLDRHRFKRAAFLALLTLLLMLPAGVLGSSGPIVPDVPAPSAENGEPTIDALDLWSVELASPPAAEGTNSARLRQEKANCRSSVARAGI